MLDKSVPYYGVLMLKKDLHNYPRFTTPAGYTIRFWRDPDDEEAWCALQTAAGQFDDLSQAHRRYQLEFAPYPRKLEQRMLFALDPMEEPCCYCHPLGRRNIWQDAPAHPLGRYSPAPRRQGAGQNTSDKCAGSLSADRQAGATIPCYPDLELSGHRTLSTLGFCPLSWRKTTALGRDICSGGWMADNKRKVGILSFAIAIVRSTSLP